MTVRLYTNISMLNPLESRGNYSARSNNMKLVHWPLMGGLLHLVQRGGDWARGRSPPRPLLASVPITVLQCSAVAVRFMGIKGLTRTSVLSCCRESARRSITFRKLREMEIGEGKKGGEGKEGTKWVRVGRSLSWSDVRVLGRVFLVCFRSRDRHATVEQ